MNNTSPIQPQPLYPSISHTVPENINPFHQKEIDHQNPSKDTNPFVSNTSIHQDSKSQLYPSIADPQDDETKVLEPHEKPTSSISPKIISQLEKQVRDEDEQFVNDPNLASSSLDPKRENSNNEETWGTHIMGYPAVPTCHPNNKKAALWGASADEKAQQFHYPYLQYSPIDQKPNNSTSNPKESILHVFNSWSNKAESLANNIWHNLKTGPSVSGAAWAKMNLTAKAITGGGFESLYKHTFATFPNEKLKKTFACYLSTSTGPVAGTLYLSNINIAFCSDRPLSFTAPSGQQTWSYYKVMVPLGNIGTINPVVMRENSTEKYIQILTVDGHDFWYMGFVNYDKACRHLTESISNLIARGIAIQSPIDNQK